MQQEFYFHFTQAIKAKVTGYICGVAALGLLASVPAQKTEEGKTLALIGSLSLSVASSINFRTQEESNSALNDWRINTGLSRQRNLFSPAATAKEAGVEEEAIDWFDFSSIGNDRDKFPNVVVMGEPGSGKTSLAEYLGVVLKANQRYAIHPHAKPTDFAGFTKVWGGGRNYGSAEDETLDWEEIISGKVRPSIAQVLTALLELMNERYERYYQGESAFETVDVYIDELPSIVTNLGKKFIASILPQLLMECRKVGIRIWLLTQGSQVKMLGLEGMSDLREGITFIRLGRLAVKHTKSKAMQEFLRNMSRPCLVDDSPAKLPGWSEMTGAIKTFVRASAAIAPAQVPEQPIPPKPAAIDLANEYIDERDFKRLPELIKANGGDLELMRAVGRRLITEFGKSKSSIIKDAWGFEGGRYQEGSSIYEQLELSSLVKPNQGTA